MGGGGAEDRGDGTLAPERCSQGNPDKDLGLGAVNFPEVLAELKKLNAMISPPPLEKESVAVSAEN
jgi:hypothetical protein